MKKRFVIEIAQDFAIEDNYIVKDTENGWFIPFSSKIQAETICNKLNELDELGNTNSNDKLDLHSDFKEWDKLIKFIDKTSRRISELDEIYKEEFKTELQNAIETGVDFKSIYGGNTEKTRKQYVDEQLADLLLEKRELEFLKADDIRRIDFIKHLIKMKLQMISIAGVDV